ncbi:Aste57867_12319 [Aphanomyces stellatus]|uniref:Aste57867_12319 protein n=1 Tax=Aphanomyces stellatus TaxID=120398 RepID=A0A485KW18_9STRA|nr:hypothetical protein As57867_012273 [Aphanomyces stellatus]VFT89171.1 Aste57867_12319 [Aphanomyces stellatus]
MDVFGLRPLDDPLELVVCKQCSKPIKKSHAREHVKLCLQLSDINHLMQPLGVTTEEQRALVTHAATTIAQATPRKPLKPLLPLHQLGRLAVGEQYKRQNFNRTLLRDSTRQILYGKPTAVVQKDMGKPNTKQKSAKQSAALPAKGSKAKGAPKVGKKVSVDSATKLLKTTKAPVAVLAAPPMKMSTPALPPPNPLVLADASMTKKPSPPPLTIPTSHALSPLMHQQPLVTPVARPQYPPKKIKRSKFSPELTLAYANASINFQPNLNLSHLEKLNLPVVAMPSAMTTSPKGEKRETKKPKKMKTEHGHKNATISNPLAQAAGLTRTTAYAWQEIQFPDVLATTHEMASVDESSNLLDDLLKDF